MQDDKEYVLRKNFLLESIVNHENAMVCAKNLDLEFIMASDIVVAMFGQNVIGKKMSDIIEDKIAANQIDELCRMVIETGKTITRRIVINMSGQMIYLQSSYSPLLDVNNTKIGVSIMAINVTEQVEQENNIRRLTEALIGQYLKLKEYAFINAHKIRAPLTNIMAIADLFSKSKENITNDLLSGLITSSNILDVELREVGKILRNTDFEGVKDIIKNKTKPVIIWLVDDDPIQDFINRHMLESLNENIAIHSFTNPLLAIEQLKSKENYPDILFLDLNMPELNGWGFLDYLNKNNINVRVYILTTSMLKIDYMQSQDYELVKGYFVKPLRAETVLPLIKQQKIY